MLYMLWHSAPGIPPPPFVVLDSNGKEWRCKSMGRKSKRLEDGISMLKTLLNQRYLTRIIRFHGKRLRLGWPSLEALQRATQEGHISKVRASTLRFNQTNAKDDVGNKVAEEIRRWNLIQQEEGNWFSPLIQQGTRRWTEEEESHSQDSSWNWGRISSSSWAEEESLRRCSKRPFWN